MLKQNDCTFYAIEWRTKQFVLTKALRLVTSSCCKVNISLAKTLIVIKEAILVLYMSFKNLLPKILVKTDIYLMPLNMRCI
jgi:hypothetical protein